MKERPILFSGPMVRAILDGRKTQTRRVVNPQPPNWIDRYVPSASGDWLEEGAYIRDKSGFLTGKALEVRMNGAPVKCPFGIVGDWFWVREKFQRFSNGHEQSEKAFEGIRDDVFYQADESDPETVPLSGKWRPSIHMPRWASRLTLEIVGVRVERLQGISEADAIAEGFEDRLDFIATWAEIYGSESCNANPWVWVLEFRRVSE